MDKAARVYTTIALSKLKRSNAKVTKNLGTFLVLLAVLLVLVVRSLTWLNRGELCLIYLCVFANLALKVKGQRWLTKADGKDLVEALELLLLKRTKLVQRLASCVCCAKLASTLSEQAVNALIHLSGVLGAGSLWHGILRNQAILLHQAHGKRVVATVANTLGQKRVDNTRIGWLVSSLNDVLKCRICLLKLVVEHAICLAELKGINVKLLDCLLAKYVERREHPAATTLTLVGDVARLCNSNTVGISVGTHGGDIASSCGNAHRGYGVASNAVSTVCTKCSGFLVCPLWIYGLISHCGSFCL